MHPLNTTTVSHSSWRINDHWLDGVCISALITAALLSLLWNYTGLPMQYWDESRNANNALEMLLGSHWLIPTYDGQADHWNTKPPLLIWIMAGLMKCGLEPLLAVRLPSAIATAATALMVWVAGTYGLRDRMAGIAAAAFVLSASCYMGLHGAHTGDYDTLLALFTSAYVLCFWQAVIRPHSAKTPWIASAGLCLFLAIMTKGPAGAFGLVGLGLYCMVSGNLRKIALDWRWAITLLVVVIGTSAYYLGREQIDPGYLQAVWINELGGRYTQTIEAHSGGLTFYLRLLLKEFQPAALALLLIGLPLFGSNKARKTLTQISFFAGLGILLLLSSAQTQLRWYIIPVIPLWSLACAVALVDGINKLQLHKRTGYRKGISHAVLATLLALPLDITNYKSAFGLSESALKKKNVSQYGLLFAALHNQQRLPQSLTLIDNGIDNSAGFENYNPALAFYKTLEQQKGYTIRVSKLEEINSLDGFIASCDYKNLESIRVLIRTPLFDNNQCVAGYLGRHSSP